MEEEITQRLAKIEKALTTALPKSVDENWISKNFGVIPEAIKSQNIMPFLLPCRDLLLRGGKRWRPLLASLSCELAGKDPSEAYELSPLIELIHTASLIHDDIEDLAEERRGAATIHKKYGVDTAINAGSWLYFHALSTINKIASRDVQGRLYRCANTAIRNLHIGQGMDIEWHRNPSIIPSQSEYCAMISFKTGALVKLAGEIGLLVAEKSEQEAIDFGGSIAPLGVGFQVIDDIKNITTGNKGKKRGDDIVEGKKSLPVILHLENHPEDRECLIAYFNQAKREGIHSPAIERCISLLESSHAIDTALKYAQENIDTVKKMLKEKYPHSPITALLTYLFEHTMQA